jgi:hypothetical protein
MVKLSDFIVDKVNVVDVYFCAEEQNDIKIISCGWQEVPNIPIKSFKNRIDYNIVEYNYKDITYIYDTSNDFQKVVQKNCIADKIIGNIYVAALNEETLPTHRFPCTNEINDMQKYNRIHYKYNNRIFFNIEKDEEGTYVLYLRYNHAYNVDLEKMNEEWKEIYNTLTKSIYSK